jgi:hypothetical protein
MAPAASGAAAARHDAPVVAARAVTRGPMRHFCGYFDKCPWDAAGGRLLVHAVGFDDRPPGPDDEALVGHVDPAGDGELVPLGRTRAWNFQQGAMLQWLGPDHSTRVVYNRRDGDRLVGVVVDAESREERLLDHPVAAVSRDGRHALSLNFARLAGVRPGYGYAGCADPWADDPAPADDGIRLIDVAAGTSRLILPLAAVAEVGGNQPRMGTKQWLNHALFTPGGGRFCFVHRWWGPDGALVTRLLTAGIEGGDLRCLSETGMVSHFDWRDDRRLLAWARTGRPGGGGGGGSRLVRLAGSPPFRRPPLSWGLRLARRLGAVGWTRQRLVGDRFLLFTDGTGDVEPVGLGQLVEDGHCSYAPDGRWILMDTYPHEDRMRTLLLYDPRARRRVDVGRFHSRDLPEEIRCDLHAKWDREGRRVCIDSTHEGGRQVYVLDVGAIVSRAG